MRYWKWLTMSLLVFTLTTWAKNNGAHDKISITPEATLKAISIIEDNPLAPEADAAVASIIDFSIQSDKVLITLDEKTVPWLAKIKDHKYGKLLLGAYIAGDVRTQLNAGVCKDQPDAGIAQVIATYQYLKQHAGIKPIPEIEKLIKRSGNDDAIWAKHLSAATKLLRNGNPLKAISDHLDPVIAHFEKEYRNDPRKIYCADSPRASLIYLVQAAAKDAKGTAESGAGAIVLPQTWAEAYYLKAYAQVDLHQLDQARKNLRKATGLSPYEPKYWSELGNLFQLEKEWKKSLIAYGKAEEASAHYKGDEKIYHLTRAWRGMGYTLVEQGKLDEAEAKYKQCLKLNPNDNKAKAELNYIKGLREKRK